ncbi:MAG: ABC transporter permease [Candidatus Paracaedibacteraceae bacterium]|nr:ABC transporter permease [Candidatus Paracaedibacteraceae bacterium]
MNLIQLTGALELGLIYSIVAMGIYLSFRTLQFPDMTVDGSFPLGAAICAACILYGAHPLVATFAAMLGGALSGYITALMATRLRMLNLLAGILTMIALYSINLRIMGRPNMAISGEKTIFSEYLSALAIPTVSTLLVPLLVIVIIVGLIALLFLRTELGLGLRAAGSNPKMARAKGINDQNMIQLGLGISNAYVALAGALFAQTQGFADVNMGTGTIVYGLAAVILGEALLPIRNLKQALLACVAGAVLYRFVLSIALNTHEFGLQASDLNLITALIMVIAMQVPEIKRRLKL